MTVHKLASNKGARIVFIAKNGLCYSNAIFIVGDSKDTFVTHSYCSLSLPSIQQSKRQNSIYSSTDF